VEGFQLMRRSVLLVFLLIFLAPAILAADYKDLNEKGVKAFKREAYDSSLQYFQEALEENPENKAIDFNLGNALHQQGMYQDALQSYEMAARSADSSLSAESFYNIGNTHFRAGELGKAAEAYKKSLNYAPDDKDTKYNLELALKKLEEQQQQQNQCDQDNKDQDQKDQDKKDQDKQDQNQDQKQDQEKQQDEQQQKQDQQEKKQDQEQEQKNQDQQDEQEKEQEQKQDQEQQQQQQDQGQEQDKDSQQTPQGQQEQSEGEPPKLDQQRAQALLEGLNEDEKEVLKQQIKQKIGVSSYKGKDW